MDFTYVYVLDVGHPDVVLIEIYIKQYIFIIIKEIYILNYIYINYRE